MQVSLTGVKGGERTGRMIEFAEKTLRIMEKSVTPYNDGSDTSLSDISFSDLEVRIFHFNVQQ
jgi:hypothetical protein